MSLLAPTRPHLQVTQVSTAGDDLVIGKKVTDLPDNIIPVGCPALKPTHSQTLIEAARQLEMPGSVIASRKKKSQHRRTHASHTCDHRKWPAVIPHRIEKQTHGTQP